MSNSQNLDTSRLVNIPLSRLKGIGPKKESSLNSLDIFSVLDILTHFPRRYIDRTNEAKISSLQVGEEGMILVEILNVYKQKTRNRRSLVTAKVTDQTGNVTLTFFNQPWREKQLKVGTEVIIFGKLDQYRGEYRMVNPVVDLIGDKTGKFIPVYAQSGKAGHQHGSSVTGQKTRLTNQKSEVSLNLTLRHKRAIRSCQSRQCLFFNS